VELVPAPDLRAHQNYTEEPQGQATLWKVSQGWVVGKGTTSYLLLGAQDMGTGRDLSSAWSPHQPLSWLTVLLHPPHLAAYLLSRCLHTWAFQAPNKAPAGGPGSPDGEDPYSPRGDPCRWT
jgi:hypothetical protein